MTENSIYKALTLSDDILVALVDNDLEKVAELDRERLEHIEKYYQKGGEIDEALTRELKQKNDEIVSKLNQLQNQTRSEQSSLNRSQKATKAYLQNT